VRSDEIASKYNISREEFETWLKSSRFKWMPNHWTNFLDVPDAQDIDAIVVAFRSFTMRSAEGDWNRDDRWRNWAAREHNREVWFAETRRLNSVQLPVATRWEYKVVNIGAFQTQERLEPTLDSLGAAGWELVTVFDKLSNWFEGIEKGFVLFKRPVQTMADVAVRLRAEEQARAEYEELRRKLDGSDDQASDRA